MRYMDVLREKCGNDRNLQLTRKNVCSIMRAIKDETGEFYEYI